MTGSDAIEGEVFLIDRVQGVTENPCLSLVMLIREQLQLNVRVTSLTSFTLRQVTTLDDGHYESSVISLVPENKLNNLQKL